MEDYIQKFLYNGDDRNMVEVYVAGRRVIARWSRNILEGKAARRQGAHQWWPWTILQV